MNIIIITSLIVGAIAGLFFYPIMILPQKIKKIMEVKRFTEILTEDAKFRMTKDVAAKVPFDEIPSNIDEVLKKYYPKLPTFKKLFDLPVSELADKVDWVIDPKELFQEK